MNLHEYQAKDLLKKYNVPVQEGVACSSVDEAVAAYNDIKKKSGSKFAVVKAQIHAGGRGKGQIKEKDFYSYCARKIRDLMKLFPCAKIAMDAQGGGIAVMEALHSSNTIGPSEQLFWPVIDENKKQPWDNEKGLHILEMCQFANYEWYSEANHSLRKDLEDKVLLFPYFDSITLGISNAEDGIKGRTYDTLEDCVMEIEELKNELSTIQMTQTATIS